jgi:hypothetical protein
MYQFEPYGIAEMSWLCEIFVAANFGNENSRFGRLL